MTTQKLIKYKFLITVAIFHTWYIGQSLASETCKKIFYTHNSVEKTDQNDRDTSGIPNLSEVDKVFFSEDKNKLIEIERKISLLDERIRRDSSISKWDLDYKKEKLVDAEKYLKKLLLQSDKESMRSSEDQNKKEGIFSGLKKIVSDTFIISKSEEVSVEISRVNRTISKLKSKIEYLEKQMDQVDPLENQRIRHELNDLNYQARLLRERIKIEEKDNRPLAISYFKEQLSRASLKDTLQGLLDYNSVTYLEKSKKTTILTESHLDGVFDKRMASQIANLVARTKNEESYILFNGDSIYAEQIIELAGKYAIPIFSSRNDYETSRHENKMFIPNPYYRMEAYSDSKKVISTTGSSSGLGMTLDGRATHILSTRDNFQFDEIKDWVGKFKFGPRDLGLERPKAKIVSNIDQIFSSFDFEYGFDRWEKSRKNKSSKLYKFNADNTATDSLHSILAEAISYHSVAIQNKGTGGSVFFGSGRKDELSTALIYESAYALAQLGYAVATGGSGGAMETANQGAFNGGGISVGIPISGRKSLSTEKVVKSEIHTLTIPTADYSQRIPLLLGEGSDTRKLVVFAPGGAGTIKELATTFLSLELNSKDLKKIVFLDSSYYREVFQWLKDSDLSPEIKEKLVLIDRVEELEALGRQFQEPFEARRVKKPRLVQPNYNSRERQDFSSETSLDRSGREVGTNEKSSSESDRKKERKKSKNRLSFRDYKNEKYGRYY